MQNLVIFGANGRVGSSLVDQALDRGHQVVAAVRRPETIITDRPGQDIRRCDATDPADVSKVLGSMPEGTSVAMCVGTNVFRRSTLVTRATEVITESMSSHRLSRYVGVGGIAQMDATRGGRWTLAVVRAVIKAATDHQGAYDHLVGTELDWVLAGCPQIVKGEPRPVHHEFGKVPGRRLVVTAGSVAKFLLEEVESDRFNRQIVGVWNS